MRILAIVAVLAATPLTASGQDLRITGPGGRAAVMTAADLAKLPRVSFLFDAHGQKHVYEGPLLIDVLATAGTPTGKALRGPALAHAVVARGADGYTVVYGLAELDPATRANRIILADRADGQPLNAKDGPFKVVAEGDLRPARGARMVISLDVVNLGGGAAPIPTTSHSH